MSALTDAQEIRALEIIDTYGFQPEGLTDEGRQLAIGRGWDPNDERTATLVMAVVMAKVMG